MDRIPLVHSSLGEQELAAVAEVFASGWPAGQGPAGKALEGELAARFGVADAVAVSNCGAALHLSLLALGVSPGDEVIVADFTFPAPAHAVRYMGAEPVFADVRADTGTVDPESVQSLIGPRTVGVIAVDTLGLPADYDELQAIADRHGLFLVEDAACAVGATYRGRPAGALSEVACLSFHGRKGATCGEGGALLSSNPSIGADARLRSSFGIGSIFDRASVVGLPIPEFTELGYNYKLSDIAAAIVRVQLGRSEELLERRNDVAAWYGELLADDELLTVPHVPEDRTHAWQSYLITLDACVDRSAVAAELRAQGVECGHGTWACHLEPIYDSDQSCPVSADLFRRSLALPMHAELSRDQVERVVDVLHGALREHARPQDAGPAVATQRRQSPSVVPQPASSPDAMSEYGGSMSVASEVERLYTAVEESAAAVGVACSRDKVWPILDAYADAVPTAMIAFRVANHASHDGEFDCRISLPPDTDPYGVALAGGFLAATDHPIGSLVSDIRERFPVDSYGIDFGVVGGFKKIWVFFPEGDFQDLKRLVELPSMPPSVAENMEFFVRHGMSDRVGLIGIDYAGQTVNLYFGDLPAACHEPANIVAMHRDIELPDPSEHMVKFCEQAFGIYTTMSWDSDRVGRIAFSVMTSDPLTLPVRLGAKIERFARFARSASYGADSPFMAHASVTSTGEEYYKLQSYYRWRPHKVNLRSEASEGTA